MPTMAKTFETIGSINGVNSLHWVNLILIDLPYNDLAYFWILSNSLTWDHFAGDCGENCDLDDELTHWPLSNFKV